jgi:type I restriction enzyme, S subunit
VSSKKPKQGYKLVKTLFGKYEEIPEDWNSEPISYFAEKDSGEWGIEYQDHILDGYTQAKILRNTDFKKWGSEKGKFAPIRLIPKNKMGKVTLSAGDILIETSGGGPDQPLGRTIMIDKTAITQSKYPLVFSNFLARFRIKNIDSEFLYYFLQRYYQSKLMKNFETQTTNLRNFDMKFFLKRFRIFFPDLGQQEKITSILSNVDYIIESCDKSIKSTKKIKNGLMQQLLTKGIGHKKFKKEKFCFSYLKGNFPESWKNIQIKQSCKIVRGGSPRPAGDPKYFGGPINWITVGELTKDDFMFLKSTKKGLTVEGSTHSRMLENGTVVISNSGYTLGHPKILGISGCANDGVAAFIEINEELVPKFLYYSLKHWTKHLRNVNQGVFQVNLNTGILGNLYLPLPSIKEQEKIVSILSRIDERVMKLELQMEHLKNFKKGIMQNLLTGKIQVKV